VHPLRRSWPPGRAPVRGRRARCPRRERQSVPGRRVLDAVARAESPRSQPPRSDGPRGSHRRRRSPYDRLRPTSMGARQRACRGPEPEALNRRRWIFLPPEPRPRGAPRRRENPRSLASPPGDHRSRDARGRRSSARRPLLSIPPRTGGPTRPETALRDCAAVSINTPRRSGRRALDVQQPRAPRRRSKATCARGARRCRPRA